MISILKWLNRNEFLVHVAVGVIIFYGLPILYSSLFYPQALEMLVGTALGTLLIVSLGTFAAYTAFFVTSLIKNAVLMASLQEAARPLHEIANDKTLDLSSESVIVVKATPKKPRKVKTNPEPETSVSDAPTLVADTAETVTADAPAPVAKKRSARSKKTVQEN